jgi:hypothetical protein
LNFFFFDSNEAISASFSPLEIHTCQSTSEGTQLPTNLQNSRRELRMTRYWDDNEEDEAPAAIEVKLMKISRGSRNKWQLTFYDIIEVFDKPLAELR